MNTTGCPPGWSTDGAFQHANVGACETPLAAYYVATMGTTAIALVAAIKQTQNWCARPKHASNIPRGPIMSFLFIGLQFIGYLLIGFGYLTYENGLALSMYTIMFLNFAYIYTLGVVRLVSLGEKIIPRSRRPAGESSINLRTFDGFGKFLFAAQIFFLVTSSVVLIILSPILLDQRDIISRLGWGLKSLFVGACQVSYWYQFERCIKVIRSVQVDTKYILPSEEDKRARKDDLSSAIMKMRKNQLVHLLACPGSILFFLLAVGGVPGNFFVVLAPITFQAIAALLFEFSLKGNRKRTPRSPKLQDKVMAASIPINMPSPAPGTTSLVPSLSVMASNPMNGEQDEDDDVEQQQKPVSMPAIEGSAKSTEET